jgi:cell division protein FtsN
MVSRNVKDFEFRLKKAGLIVVICGMAALLCLSFFVGVNIGKNIDTYPEKISSLPEKVLALIWHKNKIQPTENLTDDKSSNDQVKEENIDLTFYKTLSSKKGMATEKSAHEKKPEGETKPPEETISGNALRETSQQPQAAIADKTKEEDKQKIKETKYSTELSKNKYIVQAASLKEKAKAYQLNKQIAAIGFDAKIIPVEIKNKGTWYRVIISGFENKAKAQKAAEKISKKTGSSCIIRNIDNANN